MGAAVPPPSNEEATPIIKRILAFSAIVFFGLGVLVAGTQLFQMPAIGSGGPGRYPQMTHGGIDDPIPGPIGQSSVQITLETVATGLTAPNMATFAPGFPDRLFVSDQDGILWGIDLATGQKGVFLDLSGQVIATGEQGLLGVAFHPGYLSNGLLYTFTSLPVDGPADFSTMPEGVAADHQSVIAEWQVLNPSDPSSRVDITSFRELLRIDEPQPNHNGGGISFGPDGKLYISLGDGGAGDDQGIGHGELGNGQDPSNVLGSILRIAPAGSNSANRQYGIPAKNPFVGVPGFVDEIAAYGFRNPFRFSFDTATGAVFVADVGQNDIDEIDVGVPGGNYGWNLKEGSFCFDPNGGGRGFVVECVLGDLPPGLIDPVAEYDHDEGIAIIGGFVYRGAAIPDLQGRYVFGDFGGFFNPSGRLFHLDLKDWLGENTIVELQPASGELGLALLGFGQDSQGELYVLANDFGVPSGSSGVVLRIVPAP